MNLSKKGTLIEPIERVDKELVKLDILHHHEIETKKIEADIENQKWKSCCFQLEPKSTQFFGKLIISLLTFALCSYQLVLNTNNCTAQIAYSSLLSMVIGSYLKI